MRTVLNRSISLWLLTAALCALPLAASAQSFDEFDDDFDDRQRGDTTSTTSSSSSSTTTSTATDEFGDEDTTSTTSATTTTDTTSSSTTSSSTTSSSSADHGHAYDARGDLLGREGSWAWRRRRFTLHNTWGGSTGGIHVVDAGSGPAQSFRVGLLTNFFILNNWLNAGDHNQHIGGALSMSWTPLDFLELYASVSSSANANNTESPSLFQVLGDTLVGVKAYYEVIPALTIGGDVSVALLNTVGDIGLVARSISARSRASSSR